MALKHHNADYDGGSPDLPLRVGDRFYAQDRVRDFHFLDQQSALAADLLGKVPFLIQGGGIKRGTGDTISISEQIGYVYWDVKVPNSWSAIPPTVTTEKRLVRVTCPALSNQAVASATLDGSTWNYVKLRYAETDQSSRSRAKKAGSYYSEKLPSYSLVVNSTAPTDYDLVVGRFRGTTGNPWVFQCAKAIVQVGSALEAISSGDAVSSVWGEGGLVAKAFVHELHYNASLYSSATAGPAADMMYLNGRWLLLIGSREVTTTYPMVGIYEWRDGSIHQLVSIGVIESVASEGPIVSWIGEGGDFVLLWKDTVAGNIVYRVGNYSESSGLTWLTSKTTVEASTATFNGQVQRIATSVVLFVFNGSGPVNRYFAFKYSGGATVGVVGGSSNGSINLSRVGIGKDSDVQAAGAYLLSNTTSTRTDFVLLRVNLSTLAITSQSTIIVAGTAVGAPQGLFFRDGVFFGSMSDTTAHHLAVRGIVYIDRQSTGVADVSVQVYDTPITSLGMTISKWPWADWPIPAGLRELSSTVKMIGVFDIFGPRASMVVSNGSMSLPSMYSFGGLIVMVSVTSGSGRVSVIHIPMTSPGIADRAASAGDWVGIGVGSRPASWGPSVPLRVRPDNGTFEFGPGGIMAGGDRRMVDLLAKITGET